MSSVLCLKVNSIVKGIQDKGHMEEYGPPVSSGDTLEFMGSALWDDGYETHLKIYRIYGVPKEIQWEHHKPGLLIFKLVSSQQELVRLAVDDEFIRLSPCILKPLS